MALGFAIVGPGQFIAHVPDHSCGFFLPSVLMPVDLLFDDIVCSVE